MSEETVSVSVPLDADGFVRRECPSCERQFKWRYSEPDPEQEEASPDSYFCPYCAEPADVGQWWTSEQVEYAQRVAAAQVLAPQLRRFKRDIEGRNRRNSFFRLSLDVPDVSEPEPLTEPNDMVRVDLPCHPQEPLKVDEDWCVEVACLICGIKYPVGLIRPLPDDQDER